MNTVNAIENSLLLVDDEEDIREVLQLPLEDLGYRVLTAENAETALDIFRQEKPAMVLTDIKMPGMDGIELLQEIKKDSPDTEVIMITGHGDMNLAIKSLKYEATDFIIKPINVNSLEIALGRAEERIRTRLKLLEYTRNLEQLIREKTELQDHLSSLGLLISSVSHGIKGLVTRLDGGIYLLDSGISKNDSGQIAAGRDALQQTAVHIKKLVQDILYYAKERPLSLETVNTAAFAKEVIATIQPRIDDNAIALAPDFSRAPDQIVIDPESMQSALISILENAVDACEKDASNNTHRVDFIIEKSENDLIFTIRDNGTGMDRETREKIFTLFFSSKDRRGTGLGLYIANKIITQHKGTITVESQPGRGSLFRVKMPLDCLPACG
ncbi:MAG: response regulator [Desulfobacterales bacterium]|nr:response regulator [Desulfobacterales bacterium]